MRWTGAGTARRSTLHGVDVDLRVSGEFPGDGRPKPVAFPHVAAQPDKYTDVAVDGIRVLTLPTLIQVGAGVAAAATRQVDKARWCSRRVTAHHHHYHCTRHHTLHVPARPPPSRPAPHARSLSWHRLPARRIG